jgi:hypothetical protein
MPLEPMPPIGAVPFYAALIGLGVLGKKSVLTAVAPPVVHITR